MSEVSSMSGDQSDEESIRGFDFLVSKGHELEEDIYCMPEPSEQSCQMANVQRFDETVDDSWSS